MCSSQGVHQRVMPSVCFALGLGLAVPAAAQTPAAQPPDPNPGSITLTGSFDAVSTYMFRGIRQHSTGIALWPVADLGLAVYSGDGGLKSARHQHRDVEQPAHRRHRPGRTDRKALVRIRFLFEARSRVRRRHQRLAAIYTAYTSPNNAFTTVKEIAFQFASMTARISERRRSSRTRSWRSSSTPSPGVGQADGGAKAGRYLELGLAPGYAGSQSLDHRPGEGRSQPR